MSDAKSLRIEVAPNTALLRIMWEGGGQVPDALSGLYTSAVEAQRAITAWEIENRKVDVVDSTKATAEAELAKRGPGRPPKGS